MKFDPVHDTGAIHRALVRAFSFPGRAVSIVGPASRCGDADLTAPLLAVALTLLDGESSFFSPQASRLAELTGAHFRAATEAAFLLLPEWDDAAWTDAFEQASRGTLSDPHGGATIIAVAPASVSGMEWTASGPGLEHPTTVTLPGSGPWVVARNQACVEFPLGVDLILIRGTDVFAYPRTTRLVQAGEA